MTKKCQLLIRCDNWLFHWQQRTVESWLIGQSFKTSFVWVFVEKSNCRKCINWSQSICCMVYSSLDEISFATTGQMPIGSYNVGKYPEQAWHIRWKTWIDHNEIYSLLSHQADNKKLGECCWWVAKTQRKFKSFHAQSLCQMTTAHL